MTAARLARFALIALAVIVVVWLLLAAFFGYGSLDGGVSHVQRH